MRIIFLADLHICTDSTLDTLPWVERFCTFLKSTPAVETKIFVLGDIVNHGQPEAFDVAEEIFDYIATELAMIPYQIAFLPGNHDYCAGSLIRFDQFRYKKQTMVPVCPFSAQSTHSFALDNFNFILTDSIRNGDYNSPGLLDLPTIENCLIANKTPILLLHHSLTFEDGSDHTGIVHAHEAMDFMESHSIRVVFHGHAHATRTSYTSQNIRQYGIGSIGVPDKGLTGLTNEENQFLEVRLNAQGIESISNWLWRGGMNCYNPSMLYPDTHTTYADASAIPCHQFTPPASYMERFVTSRELANATTLTRYLNEEKQLPLEQVCAENPYVVLIADAGLGKTVELEQLAFSVSQTAYLRPILIYLKLYQDEPITELIKKFDTTYQTLDPDYFLLIFDGYDELEKGSFFNRALAEFMNDFPNAHICISMRSNFYSANTHVLKQFSIHQLLPLNEDNIHNRVQQAGIEHATFMQICRIRSLASLLETPFYLNELIRLYQIEKDLPQRGKLMEQVMLRYMNEDACKFSYIKSDLDESRYEIFRALTRFACGLQLTNKTICSQTDYQDLLGRDDREYNKYSSLIIQTPDGYTFQHNAFKEFLIAKYFSTKQLAEIQKALTIPGTEDINPHWINVMGFLLELNATEQLMDWVLAVEPLIITRLEPNTVSDGLRQRLLTGILSKIVEKNIWFDVAACSTEQFAIFVQSTDTITLLLNHIANPAHFRSLYFALTLVQSFDNLYGMHSQVRDSLVACYQNPDVRPHEKRVAISAIASLGLFSNNISHDVTTRFATSKNSYIRLGIYEYLLEAHCVNQHVIFLLDGIQYILYDHENNDITNGSEHFRLEDCLNAIDAPEAVEMALEWFIHKKHQHLQFYHKEKVVGHLICQAASGYIKGHVSLFNVVYRYAMNELRTYSMECAKDVFAFFDATGTADLAFRKLVLQKNEEILYLVESFIAHHPQSLETFCILYQQGELGVPDIFKVYANRHQHTPAIFNRCNDAILKKTGMALPPPTPLFDYEAHQKESVQTFFNCLFHRDDMLNLLQQLVDEQDNPAATIKELWDAHTWNQNRPVGTHELKVALLQCGKEPQRAIDFFDTIDWDNFVLNRICYLCEHENAVERLSISSKQWKLIEEKFRQLEAGTDYHTAITETDTLTFSIASAVRSHMILQETFGFEESPVYYLGLLEIPYTMIGKLNHLRIEDKYILIEQYVASEIIKAHISELVSIETRRSVLDDLMYGCLRYQMTDCKEKAIWLCHQSRCDTIYRCKALTYLQTIFGNQVILDEVMPKADEPLFVEILGRLYSTPSKMLCDETAMRYQRAPTNALLKYLILLNHPLGLEEYLRLSSANGCSLGSTITSETGERNIVGDHQLTDAIGAINNPLLLPLLLNATRLLFSLGFCDNGFRSLWSALAQSLCKIGKCHFQLIDSNMTALREELSHNLEAVSFCNVVCDTIREQNKLAQIKVLTISEAKHVLMTIT